MRERASPDLARRVRTLELTAADGATGARQDPVRNRVAQGRGRADGSLCSPPGITPLRAGSGGALSRTHNDQEPVRQPFGQRCSQRFEIRSGWPNDHEFVGRRGRVRWGWYLHVFTDQEHSILIALYPIEVVGQ